MYQRTLQGKEKAWGPDHISGFSTEHGQPGRSLREPAQAGRGREEGHMELKLFTRLILNNLGIDLGLLWAIAGAWKQTLEGGRER